MFEICCQDDELIHDAKQLQFYAMNVEFKNVQAEDSLQYHQWKSHWLSERSNIVQEYSVQHKWVSRHDSWVDEKESTHVNERFDFQRWWFQFIQNFMIIIKRQFNWKQLRLKFYSKCT